MKNCYIFALFSILIIGAAAQPLSDGIDGVIEDILNRKLEEFRAMMKTGNPDLGIPVLAPFESDYFPNSFSFGGIIEWVEIWRDWLFKNVKGISCSFDILKHNARQKVIPLSIFIQIYWFWLSPQLERCIHKSTSW